MVGVWSLEFFRGGVTPLPPSCRNAKLSLGIRHFLPCNAGEAKRERIPSLILCACSLPVLPLLFWFPVARGTTRQHRFIAGSGWTVQPGPTQLPARVIRPISVIALILIPTKCKGPVAAAVGFQPHRSVPAELPASGLAQPLIQLPRPARRPRAWAERASATQPQQPRTLPNPPAAALLRSVIRRPPAPQRSHRIRASRTPVREPGRCPELRPTIGAHDRSVLARSERRWSKFWSFRRRELAAAWSSSGR